MPVGKPFERWRSQKRKGLIVETSMWSCQNLRAGGLWELGNKLSQDPKDRIRGKWCEVTLCWGRRGIKYTNWAGFKQHFLRWLWWATSKREIAIHKLPGKGKKGVGRGNQYFSKSHSSRAGDPPLQKEDTESWESCPWVCWIFLRAGRP